MKKKKQNKHLTSSVETEVSNIGKPDNLRVQIFTFYKAT